MTALTLACRTLPDPNALPATATVVELEGRYADALDCARNDCADWFRLEIPERGQLRVTLEPGPGSGGLSRISTTLLDGEGRIVAQGVPGPDGGDSRLQMSADVRRGTYRFSVVSVQGRAPLPYEFASSFEPAPPPAPVSVRPPPPRFRTRRVPVFELEPGRGSTSNVLLGEGSAQDLVPCLRGKLLEGGEVIGQIELFEVFPDGSRARVIGGLRGSISSRTVAEISIPLRSADRPRCDAP